jgi:hypothetical protein
MDFLLIVFLLIVFLLIVFHEEKIPIDYFLAIFGTSGVYQIGDE